MNTSNGHLYVADTGNNRIDVLDSNGAFLFAFGWNVNATTPEQKLQTCTTATGCQAGSAGAGAGQLSGIKSIAFDNSGGEGAVYVGEEGKRRVEKFNPAGGFLLAFGKGVNTGTSGNPDLCTNVGPPSNVCGSGSEGSDADTFFDSIRGIDVGPAGTVYVADQKSVGSCGNLGGMFRKRVHKFTPGGILSEQIELTDLPCGRTIGLAVDSSGSFYIANSSESGAVRKYTPSGSLVESWGSGGKVNPSFNINAIAVDPAGNLFVADSSELGNKGSTLLRYDAAGAKSLVFFSSLLQARVTEANFDATTTELYLAEDGGGGRTVRLSLPEPGPVLVPASAVASPVGNVKATLKVTFNPQGKESTARFQYVDKASFDSEGGFASPNTQTTPESAPSPPGFDNQTVSATNICVVPDEPSCLKPETTYYFRAIAKNAEGEVVGDKAKFTTKPALEITDTWISEVGTDTARLNAKVNPLGIHTGGYFQYIAEGPDYQANGFANATSIPNPAHPLDFGSGEAPVVKAAQIFSLRPGTTYHYRFVASDPYFVPIASAPGTFVTFPPPVPAELQCVNQAFRTGPSATLPDCRAYEMVTPLDKNNGDVLTRINLTGYPTNLDQSAIDGNGFAYSSYRAFADPLSAPYTNQLLAQRTERGKAGEGWSSESLAPPRERQFRFELENEYQAFSSDLSQSWLLQEGEPTLDPCAPVGFSGLYHRDTAGAYRALLCTAPTKALPTQYQPELQGFSADGSRAVVRIHEALTDDASSATFGPRPIYQTYLSIGAGQLRLVSVLPDGDASDVDSSAGTGGVKGSEGANQNRFNSVSHAISDDGTRVFWTGGFGPNADTGAGSGQLYLRINADKAPSTIISGKCNQPTRACTIPVSETVSAEPAYFQAANPQGTKALFTVTNGPLAGNLYRFDSEAKPPASELIAEGVMENILGASEDLSRVYFASAKASAQAQSEGATPGEPNVYFDEEGTTSFVAILTDPTFPPDPSDPYPDTTSPYGRPLQKAPILRTARVNPDGQSLVFMSNSRQLASETAGYDNRDLANDQPDLEVYRYDAEADALACVSCNPSGARPRGRELERGLNGQVGPYGAATIPRFQSQLYQPRYLSDDGSRVYFNSFEALVLRDTNGAQDVYQWEAPGSGSCTSQSASYVESSEGCLSLISSGQSPEDSKFLDATPSGSDVFFSTGESLLAQDYGLIDVYDARVGGGFPPPPNPPAACEGEACQGPLEAPNDPTPSSSTFQGAGNVVEEPVAKKKHKAKKKAKPKKAKQQAKKRQQRRANANRRNHR